VPGPVKADDVLLHAATITSMAPSTVVVILGISTVASVAASRLTAVSVPSIGLEVFTPVYRTICATPVVDPMVTVRVPVSVPAATL
jgi:hypothetical protein